MVLHGWSLSVCLMLGTALFFVLAILNRQLNNLGINFNQWFAYIGLLPYLVIGLLWSVKIGLVVGLVTSLLLGFFGGQWFGGDDG